MKCRDYINIAARATVDSLGANSPNIYGVQTHLGMSSIVGEGGGPLPTQNWLIVRHGGGAVRIQRSEKRLVNPVKQDPGRVRQNS